MKVVASRFVGLTVAAAATACGVAPAVAQEQQNLTLVGEAEQMCLLGTPEQAEGAVTNFDTPSGTVFAITQLADPQTLTTRAANITLAVDAMCNGLHQVVLGSDNNGLFRETTTVASGFGAAVPYRANLVWADEQYLLTADAGARRPVERIALIGRPNAGQMLIEFAIEAGATDVGVGTPLLSGEYSDILRITVEPR